MSFILKIKMKKAQDDPWVLYLVVNKDLNMGLGKVAAQCGHGVGQLDIYHESILTKSLQGKKLSKQEMAHFDRVSSWRKDSFRKIVLEGSNKTWNRLKSLDCKHFIVRDAGFTEVSPGSETVIAYLPMQKSQVPELLAKLRLLK